MFHSLERLCKDALAYGSNHAALRQSMTAFINAIRTEAHKKYGHDTVDVVALTALMQRAERAEWHRPEVYVDGQNVAREPIEELFRQAHLDAGQRSAATLISDIWNAWGRFLTVAARTYDQKSARTRARALDPWWVMGDEIRELWKDVYQPWYTAAQKKQIATLRGGMVTAAKLVIHVVVVPMFPGQLDRSERLEPGTSLRVLKEELSLLATG